MSGCKLDYAPYWYAIMYEAYILLFNKIIY